MTRNWAGTYEYTAPRIVTATLGRRRAARARRAGSRAGARHPALLHRPARHDGNPRRRHRARSRSSRSTPRRARSPSAPAPATASSRSGSRSGAGPCATWGRCRTSTSAVRPRPAPTARATRNQVLSASVRALRYVGADAEVHEVRRGDADFDALVVGLGAYGITVAVTLDIQPSFRMRQDIYTGLSWDAALADYAAVTGAGYSVSVFSTWEPGAHRVRLGQDPTRRRRRPRAGRDPRRRPRHRRRVAARADVDNVTELGGVPGPWMLRLPALPPRRAAVVRRRDPDRVLRRAAPRRRRAARGAGAGRRHPSASLRDGAAHRRRRRPVAESRRISATR